MPGRADQGQDRAGALVLGDAALLAQLLDRDVLGDAVLDVLEAGVVGVEDLAGVHGVEALVGALPPRHGDQPVEVGADHRGLAGLLAHALEPAQLALGLLAHVVGHAGLVDLRAVLLDDRGVVLAELLADRLHLLAQEVLALLLLGALLDVVADAPAHLELGQALALEAQRQLEALGDVERLEQLDLVLVGDVGRVAGGVGERAGLGDRAHEGGDAPVVAAQLEDLLDHRAVLALELRACGRRPGRRRGAPRPRRAGGPAESVWAAPATPRCRPDSGHGLAAAGQADAVRRPRRRCRRPRTRRRGAGRAGRGLRRRRRPAG